MALQPLVTSGLLALTEGLWSDYFMHGDNFDRDQARQCIYLYLSRMLPQCKRLARWPDSLWQQLSK
ncbi:MAG: hypothetical protein DRQ59_07100 [Gammaproteobacteria bacterium]|nr:MAG: hypothetical protein DRQ59_07100 [Gammaproteobacteria bacterium]